MVSIELFDRTANGDLGKLSPHWYPELESHNELTVDFAKLKLITPIVGEDATNVTKMDKAINWFALGIGVIAALCAARTLATKNIVLAKANMPVDAVVYRGGEEVVNMVGESWQISLEDNDVDRNQPLRLLDPCFIQEGKVTVPKSQLDHYAVPPQDPDQEFCGTIEVNPGAFITTITMNYVSQE